MDWFDLFRPVIFERGVSYYEAGCVKNLIKTASGYQAIVQGSENYRVEVEFEQDEPTNLDCTCPYAADGNYCKHMVAVLLAAQDDNSSELANSEREILNECLQNIDEQDLKTFLLEELLENEHLALRFKMTFASLLPTLDLNYCKGLIARIFRVHEDAHGFISYRFATDFQLQMEGFLQDFVQGMIDNQDYPAAFELSTYFYERLGAAEIDDSGGQTTMLAHSCYEMWQTIHALANRDLKQTMYDWFKKQIVEETIIDYLLDPIQDFFREAFTDREFLHDKLEFADSLITKYSAIAKDRWITSYYMEEWVFYRLEVMADLGMPEDALQKFRKKFWHLPKIRQAHINACLETGDLPCAIAILEESRSIDADYAGLLAEYSLLLKDLYQEVGNETAYRNELWRLVTSRNMGDLELYKELKALYTPEDWREKREKILATVTYTSKLHELYAEEGLLDRLIFSINKLNNRGNFALSELSRYEGILKQQYSAEILDILERCARSLAVPVSNRSTYREIVAILRWMKEYPGGADLAFNLAREFRQAYPRRRAMIEELAKV